jgi:hypothetical protein
MVIVGPFAWPTEVQQQEVVITGARNLPRNQVGTVPTHASASNLPLLEPGLGEPDRDLAEFLVGAGELKLAGIGIWTGLKGFLRIGARDVARATAKELNQIAHVFPRAEKNLAALAKASGSELNALRSVQAAANQALADGRLVAGCKRSSSG